MPKDDAELIDRATEYATCPDCDRAFVVIFRQQHDDDVLSFCPFCGFEFEDDD